MSQTIEAKVWCPLCKKNVQLLKVTKAAKLIDVHRRTIYRYIEEGSVHAIKIVGKTYRVWRRLLIPAAGRSVNFQKKL